MSNHSGAKPSAQQLEEQQRRQQLEVRQFVMDCKRLFLTVEGQRVLTRLCRQFGYNEPSATAGLRNEEVWLREGMKMPLRLLMQVVNEPVESEPAKTETKTETKEEQK